MEPRRSARWIAGAACLVLVASTSAAWSDPAGPAAARDGPVVVKGVVVTARHRPTDAPPPLDAYATPAKFELIALSPDASQVAFVARTRGMRLLAAYRFADHARRIVKLVGVPSALAWADADHVLVTASGSALRGTCDAGDQGAIEIKAMATDRALEAAMDTAEAAAPSARGTAPTPDAEAMRSAIQGLRSSASWGHGCVYYGVREQSAVTLVDLTNRTGRSLGLRMGDNVNRPLGTPELLTIGGKPALAGPFLELRTSTPDDEPVERVYLWRIDPKTGDGRSLDDGGGDISRRRYYADDWLLTPQGVPAARSGYDFSTGAYSIQTKARGAWKAVLKRAIVPKDHTFAPMLIGLGRDGDSIVILDQAKAPAPNAAGRTFHYYALAADGRLSGPLEPDDAARDRPVFDPRTGRVAGFDRSGVSERYALSDPDLQSLYQHALDAVPGQNVEIVSTADDPRKMIIRAEGAEDPGSYYFVDFSTGASQPLGEDHGQIPSAWVADQRLITYEAADGLEIEAILTLPPKPDPRRLPLIVLPHDGPQAHDKLGFDWLAQALASRGYLVLQPNYRGSDGYGRIFREAGRGQLGRKMQSDLSDGVNALVAQGLADPKRVCIVGLGMGGYAALTAAATEAGTYRCAASLDGVSDPEAFAAWLKSRRTDADQDQITTLAADVRWPRTFEADPSSPQILESYIGADGATPVPVKLAGRVAMPVLLVSESRMKAVPSRQSRAMRDALQASGKDVEFVEVKDGADQALATKEARLETLTALMDFLAKRNPAQ